MEKIRVDGANGIRFSTRKIFSSGNGLPFNGAFTSTAASESISRIPKTDINPNKAIFTIDSKSSNILIVNNKACELLDYRPSELCDMQFLSLLTNKTNKKSYVSALAEGQLNTTDGTMVLLSGKVVEMTTKKGSKVAVSLWIRQIDADVGRMLCVAEPVQRRIAQIVVDKNGKIISTDDETFMLFQIDTDEIYGSDIRHLIPAIQLPNAENSSNHKTIYKQKATGKAKDNLSFPLCLMIAPKTEAESAATSVSSDCGIGGDSIPNTYVITIWVFQNISGLVVIDESGSIELCNHHFSMLMFGYAQSKITQLHITNLIPNFAQELEYLDIGDWNCNGRSRNITFSSMDNESETETDPVYYEAESFYATPVGTTSNHSRSKSTNENENSIYEMSSSVNKIKIPFTSKAISEPIDIPKLDSLVQRFNVNDVAGLKNKTQIVGKVEVTKFLT
ncbi:PAS domain-containing serine/threonine-protein kinase, partial [Contarinia nasturtii]|uniref:PAS domain-containing serine/threonine-protein kinase n=1 Tax=Contarinia nasturtii TaxID=265458 RepID=UPI0012D45CD6